MQPMSRWAAVIGVLALALASARAEAQGSAQNAAPDYPNRSVTIVAPSAPGGMYSILARLIAGKLERLYGKSFVVENRPGASSVTGSVAVIRSPPDGYTLMVAASTTMATNVTLHRNLPYDPLTDFIPLTLIALSPEVVLINAALPVQSIDDLVRLARTTPGGLSFGSAGPGTGQHLNGEQLKHALGVEMRHIPYKGIQPALNDLAGGHIDLMSSPIPVALPLAQSGRVRMLGVTTKERVGAIPEVPSLAEIGVPGYDARSWFMLVAAAKTPRAIVEKLHADLGAVLSEADVREEFILRQGLIPVRSPPPDELRRFVASEIDRLGDIVRKAGLAGSE
jgi:tripartite-type tricarboxylate transporter receptor subunit TctC